MRTIIFRGKRIDNGGWAYGNFVEKTRWDLHKDYFVTWNKLIKNPNDSLTDSEYIEEQVDPDTVGQFTGLTDKNGKEIYEGDIVALTFYSDLKEHARLEERPEITENYVILFNDGRYWMKRIVVPDGLTAQLYGRRLTLESLWKNRLEVIGNIHDNPELMKMREKNERKK